MLNLIYSVFCLFAINWVFVKKIRQKLIRFCSGFGFDEMSSMLDVKSVLCCVHAGRLHILLLQSLLNGSHKY